MLDDGETVLVVKIIEKLVTRSKALQNSAIGLGYGYRDVSQIGCMNMAKAETHQQQNNSYNSSHSIKVY